MGKVQNPGTCPNDAGECLCDDHSYAVITDVTPNRGTVRAVGTRREIAEKQHHFRDASLKIVVDDPSWKIGDRIWHDGRFITL